MCRRIHCCVARSQTPRTNVADKWHILPTSFSSPSFIYQYYILRNLSFCIDSISTTLTPPAKSHTGHQTYSGGLYWLLAQSERGPSPTKHHSRVYAPKAHQVINMKTPRKLTPDRVGVSFCNCLSGASHRRSPSPADHSIRRGIWLNEPDPECANLRRDLGQSEPRLRGYR